jgi:hypothetical protein
MQKNTAANLQNLLANDKYRIKILGTIYLLFLCCFMQDEGSGYFGQ